MIEIPLAGTPLAGAQAYSNVPVAGQPYFHLRVADSNYQFDGIPNADSFWKNGALPVGNAQVVGQRKDGRGEIHPTNGDGFVSILLTSGSNYDPSQGQEPPMRIFVALNPRKDDTTAIVSYDAKLSDEIWVGNIINHTHWSIAFNEQAAPVPPDDNPAYTGMSAEEAARERVWSYVGVAYNKGAALIRFGASATPYPNAAGAPQTGELKYRLDGAAYLCQGFAGFITYVKVGDWGNVRRADWFG